MCGRVALFTPPTRLARLLDAALAAGVEPEGVPSWNVSPQKTLFAVTESRGERTLDRYRWGLLPGWAKDPALANRLFNARGETVAEKPSFRAAFAKRPCVIPVDGFYEWDRTSGTREPHYFTRADGDPIVFAGLHEVWRDPATPDAAETVRTCTIITTTPGEDMDGLHDRMPVVLELDDVDAWLDVDEHMRPIRQSLLVPAAAGTLVHHEVGRAVGPVRNDGPELIEPVSSSLF